MDDLNCEEFSSLWLIEVMEEEIHRKEYYWQNRPEGSFGIMVDTDDNALNYQKHDRAIRRIKKWLYAQLGNR